MKRPQPPTKARLRPKSKQVTEPRESDPSPQTKQVKQAKNSKTPPRQATVIERANPGLTGEGPQRGALPPAQQQAADEKPAQQAASMAGALPATPKEDTQGVNIRSAKGKTYPIILPPDFESIASYWGQYVLRNRSRWSQDESASQTVQDRCIELLNEIGINEDQQKEIGSSDCIEINIPYVAENLGWELRIFPWEFVLFTATVKYRTGPLIVVRHVSRDGQRVDAVQTPKSCMVVESAPGKLDQYSFASERRLVETNLSLEKVTCPPNPTLEQLTETIKQSKPDVIHLAGIDAHQGRQLLGLDDTNEWDDGYFLADPKEGAIAVDSQKLAKAMQGNPYRPALVSCNFYNSGARVAAMIAAVAADAAIGFQDEIDDRTAENFFAKFYFNWRTLGWDLLRALRLTVSGVHLGGAIVVLWSTRSLLAGIQNKPLIADKDQVIMHRTQPAVTANMDVRDVLEVTKPKLKDRVNYSLLHNDEDLFEEFVIRKLVDGCLNEVAVEVTLAVGSDSFPYRCVFNMDTPMVLFANNDKEDPQTRRSIRFPLTSNMMRSIRESINTVISIEVKWNNQIFYRDTPPIKLLAIDEWVDTPELDAYLPSFIFPRDRAVAKIIDESQQYLISLNDDSGAGFDGYQGVDRRARDPFATVDLQARAIWSALTIEKPLSYINPPPTFTESSQRLRTPTDVMDGRRGTCIDLALLFAACMEYVGIYPVIFLLNDHAFPGYWRSDEAQQRFIEPAPPDTSPTPSAASSTMRDTAAPAPTRPWMFTDYAEVVQLTRRGDVVPIETVDLTQHVGFWEAVDDGMDNLRSRREFSSMIDVQYARTNKTKPVTPLPLLGVTP